MPQISVSLEDLASKSTLHLFLSWKHAWTLKSLTLATNIIILNAIERYLFMFLIVCEVSVFLIFVFLESLAFLGLGDPRHVFGRICFLFFPGLRYHHQGFIAYLFSYWFVMIQGSLGMYTDEWRKSILMTGTCVSHCHTIPYTPISPSIQIWHINLFFFYFYYAELAMWKPEWYGIFLFLITSSYVQGHIRKHIISIENIMEVIWQEWIQKSKKSKNYEQTKL